MQAFGKHGSGCGMLLAVIKGDKVIFEKRYLQSLLDMKYNGSSEHNQHMRETEETQIAEVQGRGEL
jgi:hypothetical protein